jgi:hypothetical protein
VKRFILETLKNSCEGCNVNTTCGLKEFANNCYCPCRICLIKSICSEDCSEFVEFEERCILIMESKKENYVQKN